jgi:hypothetical protein
LEEFIRQRLHHESDLGLMRTRMDLRHRLA